MLQEFEKIKDLCKKWNSICQSIHHHHFLTTKIINKCSSTSSSASVSSSTDLNHHHQQSLVKLPNYYKDALEETKPELLSNPNSSPNSASSSEASGDLTDLRLSHKFLEDNIFENLDKEEGVCEALEKTNVRGMEKELIREIVRTIFKCRSGESNGGREDTWMTFLGPDSEGKDKIGRELAKAVFGWSKQGNLVNIGISAFSSSSSRGDDDVSMEEVFSSKGSKNKKRARDEGGMSYFDRFGVAVRENPSRVFLLEDFDQTDYNSRKRFKRAMESGRLSLPDELVYLKDAIIIFIISSESEQTILNNNNNNNRKMEEKSNRTPLDLNVATEEDDEDENCLSENGIFNFMENKFVFKN